ncbi:unnamed protein product [Schistosoma spindalis]|nr:unnamed protein product [Schistosoma spindale]
MTFSAYLFSYDPGRLVERGWWCVRLRGFKKMITTGWINASRSCLVLARTKWLMVNLREIRTPSAVIVPKDIRGVQKKR